MKHFFRSLSIGLGLSALFAAGSLNASGSQSETVSIPFEFKVDKITMPAGEYRVERDFGRYLVSVVHLKTGRRVQLLRSNASEIPQHPKLIFEPTGQGLRLARVS